MPHDPKVIAILVNVRSLQNVGSIFRTADGLGITKIYCVGTTGHPHPEAPWRRDHLLLKKTALGAESMVAWEYRTDLLPLIQELHAATWTLIALETGPHAQSLLDWRAPQPGKFALMVGPEIDGLPLDVQDEADVILSVPMRGHKESYNVAVAFALAAFWLIESGRRTNAD